MSDKSKEIFQDRERPRKLYRCIANCIMVRQEGVKVQPQGVKVFVPDFST